MTSPNWPVNIDTTYSDTGGDDVKLHQQLHDGVDAFLNEHAIEARQNGHVWRHNGTLFVPSYLTSADVPTVAFDQITGDYTFVLGDAGRIKQSAPAQSTAVTWTIPTDAVGGWSGTVSIGCLQFGTGQITVVGASGVTLRAYAGATTSAGIYAEFAITRRFSNTWFVSGNVIP